MNTVNNSVRLELSPELKGRLEERLKNLGEASETGNIFQCRQTARDTVLDIIEARWPQIAAPPTAREVENWIVLGRRGQE